MFLIRGDGNSRIGIGHLMRCMTIAEELALQQGSREEICFVCADAASGDFVRENGFRCHVLGTDYRDMESELPLWGEIWRELCIDWKDVPKRQNAMILVDSYYVTERYLAALGETAYTILMDDMGTHRYPVYCVVNYNAPADPEAYRRLYQGSGTRLLIGSRYTPLRRQFRRGGEADTNPDDILLTDGTRQVPAGGSGCCAVPAKMQCAGRGETASPTGEPGPCAVPEKVRFAGRGKATAAEGESGSCAVPEKMQCAGRGETATVAGEPGPCAVPEKVQFAGRGKAAAAEGEPGSCTVPEKMQCAGRGKTAAAAGEPGCCAVPEKVQSAGRGKATAAAGEPGSCTVPEKVRFAGRGKATAAEGESGCCAVPEKMQCAVRGETASPAGETGPCAAPAKCLCLPKEEEPVREVLITTGGGDSGNIAGKILERIYRDGISYHVVTGRFSSNFRELEKAARNRPGVQIHCDVKDMAGLMRRCQIALTAGGSTIYELAALGIPLVCFSYAENQEALVEYIGKRQIACSAGAWHRDPEGTLERIGSLFAELAGRPELRRRCRIREMEMIDGEGAVRLARAFREAAEEGKNL